MSDSKRQTSHVPASELRAIFTDYDQPTAPYEGRAVRLTLCADLAFIAIGKLTEDLGADKFTHNDEDTVGVDAEQLYETLGAMLRRADRHHADRIREGTLPADHPAHALATVPVVVPGTRRRA